MNPELGNRRLFWNSAECDDGLGKNETDFIRLRQFINRSLRSALNDLQVGGLSARGEGGEGDGRGGQESVEKSVSFHTPIMPVPCPRAKSNRFWSFFGRKLERFKDGLRNDPLAFRPMKHSALFGLVTLSAFVELTSSRNVYAQLNDGATGEIGRSVTRAVESRGDVVIQAPNAPVRLVVGRPRRRLPVEGALMGGAVSGATVLWLSGGENNGEAIAAVTGIGAVAGLLVGTAMPRSRGSVDVQLGETVRAGSLEGTVVRLDESSMWLRSHEGVERAISLDGASLEVKRGTRLAGVGAVSGGLTVGALGGLLFYALSECSGCSDEFAQGFALGGLFGAAGGAAIGAFVKVHDWRPVIVQAPAASQPKRDDNRTVRLSIAPTRGKGVRGQFAMSWK